MSWIHPDDAAITTIKATLPTVQVWMPDGTVIPGTIKSGRTKFPIVTVTYHGLKVKMGFVWAMILKSLKENRPLDGAWGAENA